MSSLAAARADNFYYPPEWTPEQGSINKFQGSHPLGVRAKKIGEGILVIRFEMPFNVWCSGCGAMIAKGVRFNAEKKQAGNYLSTKIWSFTMKSACCQTEIIVQSDPKNCEYVVVKGAERKTETFEASDAQTIELLSSEEKDRIRNDAFRKVEHAAEDKRVAREANRAVLQLHAMSRDKWGGGNDYANNKALRKTLREQKKRVAEETEEAKGRGLQIRLLPPAPEDAAEAARIHFGASGTSSAAFDHNRSIRRTAIRASSIFSAPLQHSRPIQAQLRAQSAGASPSSGISSGASVAGSRDSGGALPAAGLDVGRDGGAAVAKRKDAGVSTDARTYATVARDGIIPVSRGTATSDSSRSLSGRSLPGTTVDPRLADGMSRLHKRPWNAGPGIAQPSRPSNASGSSAAASGDVHKKRMALLAKRARIDGAGVLKSVGRIGP